MRLVVFQQYWRQWEQTIQPFSSKNCNTFTLPFKTLFNPKTMLFLILYSFQFFYTAEQMLFAHDVVMEV